MFDADLALSGPPGHEAGIADFPDIHSEDYCKLIRGEFGMNCCAKAFVQKTHLMQFVQYR
jgi:hypothetical protein